MLNETMGIYELQSCQRLFGTPNASYSNSERIHGSLISIMGNGLILAVAQGKVVMHLGQHDEELVAGMDVPLALGGRQGLHGRHVLLQHEVGHHGAAGARQAAIAAHHHGVRGLDVG